MSTVTAVSGRSRSVTACRTAPGRSRSGQETTSRADSAPPFAPTPNHPTPPHRTPRPALLDSEASRPSSEALADHDEDVRGFLDDVAIAGGAVVSSARSEEHTSELQSRRDLVCRLLLEKKK